MYLIQVHYCDIGNAEFSVHANMCYCFVLFGRYDQPDDRVKEASNVKLTAGWWIGRGGKESKA